MFLRFGGEMGTCRLKGGNYSVAAKRPRRAAAIRSSISTSGYNTALSLFLMLQHQLNFKDNKSLITKSIYLQFNQVGSTGQLYAWMFPSFTHSQTITHKPSTEHFTLHTWMQY